jgi:hypothetical protein
MFEATFDDEANKLVVERCKYARWDGRLTIPKKYWDLSVPEENGDLIPFRNVLYWFGEWITVEFISDEYLPQYLRGLERVFGMLDEEELSAFGKEWSPDNFPKLVGPPPRISPERRSK